MGNDKNLCFGVEVEHGFKTISIVGENKRMIPVASFDAEYHPCLLEVLEGNAAVRAVKNWFTSPAYEFEYFSRANVGQRNPHNTWDNICNHYKLPREFEIDPPRDTKDALPEDRGVQIIKKDSGFKHPFRRE